MLDTETKAYELLKLAEPAKDLPEFNKLQWERWKEEWIKEYEFLNQDVTEDQGR